MMFYIALGFFIFGAVVNYYNAWVRHRFDGMDSWLREQHLIIEMHDEYREEANNLWNDHIPQLQKWHDDCAKLKPILTFVQLLNTGLVFFVVLFDTVGPVLSLLAPLANAAIAVAFMELRKRRFTMEGICHGTLALIEAIKIQEEREKEIEAEREESGS